MIGAHLAARTAPKLVKLTRPGGANGAAIRTRSAFRSLLFIRSRPMASLGSAGTGRWGLLATMHGALLSGVRAAYQFGIAKAELMKEGKEISAPT